MAGASISSTNAGGGAQQAVSSVESVDTREAGGSESGRRPEPRITYAEQLAAERAERFAAERRQLEQSRAEMQAIRPTFQRPSEPEESKIVRAMEVMGAGLRGAALTETAMAAHESAAAAEELDDEWLSAEEASSVEDTLSESEMLMPNLNWEAIFGQIQRVLGMEVDSTRVSQWEQWIQSGEEPVGDEIARKILPLAAWVGGLLLRDLERMQDGLFAVSEDLFQMLEENQPGANAEDIIQQTDAIANMLLDGVEETLSSRCKPHGSHAHCPGSYAKNASLSETRARKCPGTGDRGYARAGGACDDRAGAKDHPTLDGYSLQSGSDACAAAAPRSAARGDEHD